MEGRKRKGYAWAFLAGLTAALAAISAKLFTSQVTSFILYPIFLGPIFCSVSLDFTLIPYIWSNLYSLLFISSFFVCCEEKKELNGQILLVSIVCVRQFNKHEVSNKNKYD